MKGKTLLLGAARMAAVLLGSALVFYASGVAARELYEQLLRPAMMGRQSSFGGNLLQEVGFIFAVAFVCAGVAFALGVRWASRGMQRDRETARVK